MVTLQAEERKSVGKQLAILRKQGKLPAILYGAGVPSVPLAVPLREFVKVLAKAGETSLVEIKVEAGRQYNVLIHDVARDPLTLQPIHADFYAVRMDRPIDAKVPVAFIGEAPAVKSEGGILVKVLHELEVRALPKDLPHEIQVSLEVLLNINDKVHVADVKLPPGVSVRVSGDEVVVLVEPPRSEEELAELTKAEEAPMVAEVKTEREVKTEEKQAKEVEEEEKV